MGSFFNKYVLQNKVLQHTLFWCISFYILFRVFSSSSDFQFIDIVFTALFHFTLIITVYINYGLLIPYFLKKKQFFLYGILLVITILFFSEINVLLFERWIDYIIQGYYFVAYYSFFEMLIFLSIYVLLTTLLKLSKSWFNIAQVEKEKMLSELNALKSQINPHFLFNSLNNIYSLAIKESKETPIAVLKLGDIMRYILYDAESEYISLDEEIEFIKKYISLQELRIHTQDTSIEFNIDGDISNQLIAPLILLPFFENSFKHGIKGEIENTFVHSQLKITKNKLELRLSNNLGISEESVNDKYKGFGLTNVKNRLNLIYPKSHSLIIEKTEDVFSVALDISLH